MASNTLLLGPPGLSPSGDPMVRSLQAGVYNLQLDVVKPIIPQLGFPKKESFSCSNTVNPCRNLFFSALPSMPTHALVNLLVNAWSYEPLTTLRLVCNLRVVRGTGKSVKESFYSAALWLHKNHPKTLAFNVRVFAEVDCYKDLLEILYRLLEEEKVRENAKRFKERYDVLEFWGARRMFPRKSDPDYEGIEEAHYAFRVPSVSMQNYKKHFLWHDDQRFSGYIQDVRKADETIAASALLPHEIIASLKDADDVAELQWRRMVEDHKRKGELNNCIAIF
ncbi:hypothetical protein SCA6_016078 [Theobroma cacao]